MKPMPAKPSSSIAQVDGSGTAATDETAVTVNSIGVTPQQLPFGLVEDCAMPYALPVQPIPKASPVVANEIPAKSTKLGLAGKNKRLSAPA